MIVFLKVSAAETTNKWDLKSKQWLVPLGISDWTDYQSVASPSRSCCLGGVACLWKHIELNAYNEFTFSWACYPAINRS